MDSTFLLRVARDTLGNDKVLAVTASSETYPASEEDEARTIAERLGVRHMVIRTEELENPKFCSNPPDRCYWCKSELFSKLSTLAKENGLSFCLDGSNYDDTKDFRPGMKAAAELGVRSPLKEVGLSKDEIRNLSKELGLPTWNKPSFACLASRFPYGMKITRENLAKVDSVERLLRERGMIQVRVRHHDTIARIEVLKEDMPRLLEEPLRTHVLSLCKDLGYSYVTVDLEGYRTGSMNETLEGDDKG